HEDQSARTRQEIEIRKGTGLRAPGVSGAVTGGLPATPLPTKGEGCLWRLRHPAVDGRRQFLQLDRFDEVVAGIEVCGERAGSGVRGTRDDDRPSRLDPLIGRGVQRADQAEIENEHLAGTHGPRSNRKVRVETQTPQAAGSDVGEPRVVVNHQYSSAQMARIFNLGQVSQRFTDVLKKARWR